MENVIIFSPQKIEEKNELDLEDVRASVNDKEINFFHIKEIKNRQNMMKILFNQNRTVKKYLKTR